MRTAHPACERELRRENTMPTMHFGFSYMGLLFLALLIIPNLIWTRHQPRDYDKYVGNENRLLGIYGKNLPMLAAVVIHGIGHIGIHLGHRKEITAAQRKERS